MKLNIDLLTQQSGIYRIVNRVTGKCYVGSSAKLLRRARDHASQIITGKHHSTKLRNSAKHHGADVFYFEVLELCAVEALLDRELYWIVYFDSVRQGYNMRPEPHSNRGVVHSAETRQKFSETRRGKKRTAEVRAAMSARCKGRDMRAAAIASANNRRGKPLPAATKAKIASALTGVPKAPEHVAKVVAALVGRPVSEATRQKISAAGKGRKVSVETLERLRAYRPTPEATRKWVEKMQGAKQSAEHIAKRVSSVAATKGRLPEMIGVSWNKRRQRWRVRVYIAGKETCLGSFVLVEEAIAAKQAFLAKGGAYV